MLREQEESLEELMAWLRQREDTLTQLEAEPLPDELAELQVLIKVSECVDCSLYL